MPSPVPQHQENTTLRWEYASVVGILAIWVSMLSLKIGVGLIAGLATLIEFVFAPPAIALAIGAYHGLTVGGLAERARERGVLFDIGHGGGSFGFADPERGWNVLHETAEGGGRHLRHFHA